MCYLRWAAVVCLTITAFPVFGQTTILSFNYNGIGLEGTPAFVNGTPAPGFTSTPLVRGPGLAPLGIPDGFRSNQWPASDSSTPDPTKYLGFSITNNTGGDYILNAINLGYMRQSIGPSSFVLKANATSQSFDAGSITIASFTETTNAHKSISFDLSTSGVATFAASSTIEFRLYGYTANSVSGGFQLENYNNNTIPGTTLTASPVPEPGLGLVAAAVGCAAARFVRRRSR
jgi:hypothetical protein